MRNFLIPGVCISLILGSGCDTKVSFESDTSGSSESFVAGDSPFVRVSPSELQELAQPEFLLERAHTGQRRVTFYDSNGVRTSFIERIATDGHGRFAVEPVEALTPLNTDFETFQLQQISQQGFVFRHRDFAIRDLGLFQENWTLWLLGDNEKVAGRLCDRFLAKRPGVQNAPGYQVWIDSKGFVLAYRELNAAGELLSEVRYLTYNDSPSQEVLDAVYWHEPGIDETLELDWTQDLEPQLDGARIFQPRWLPTGYELRRATRDTIGEDRWLRLKYTDGVESIFFAVDLPDLVDPGGVDIDTPFTPQTHRPDRVMVFESGRTAAVEGMLRGREVMAVGKTTTDLLLDLVESALP